MSRGYRKKIGALCLTGALIMGLLPQGAMKSQAEERAGWLPQSEMSIESYAGEHSSCPIENILDGNKDSIWSTSWEESGDVYPEDAFTIDLGGVREDVFQVKYTPRQEDINGKVKKYQILAGKTKESMHIVAGGYWAFSDTDRKDHADKFATFTATAARYITLRVHDASINASGGETKHTTTCAEFNVGCREGFTVDQQKLLDLIAKAEAKAEESEDEEYKLTLQAGINQVKAELRTFETLSKEDMDIYIAMLEQGIAGETQIEVSVKYVPSEADGYGSANMLDGNKATFFESSWADPEDYFQQGDYLVFDLGKTMQDLSRIEYTPRQDNPNGRIKRHKIWVSNENLDAVEIDGSQQFLDQYFQCAATGIWDDSIKNVQTSTFASTGARYVAIQVFRVGGDGNTIGCAEMAFGQQQDVSADQGRIAELTEELKQVKKTVGKPAADKAIDAKLVEIEGNVFTQEAVSKVEKELLEFMDTYSAIGNVTSVKSGKVWLDTDGEVIHAHSGAILYDEKEKIYYWYGDFKGADNIPTGAETGNPAVGVGCYSSKDLYNWTNEGLVLPVFNNPQFVDGSEADSNYPLYLSEKSEAYKNSPLQEFPGRTANGLTPILSKAPFDTLSQYTTPEFIKEANALYNGISYEEKKEMYTQFNWNKVVERPKVIYNASTDKYVMWWHHDGPAAGLYYDAMGGVAVSDSPTGPFRYMGVKRLLPDNEAKTGMLRDMNLFVDDDGTGYLIYSSEENATTIIHKLNEAYTDVSGTVEGTDYVRIFPGQYREAPAMFKEGDTYYLVTSGQSGWNPNPCTYSWIKGDLMSTGWSENKYFCVDDYDLSGNTVANPGSGTTFRSQSTCILPFRDQDGKKVPGQYIYIGDRWKPQDLKDSRYIWLPLEFNNEEKTMSMAWRDSWKYEEAFQGTDDKTELEKLKEQLEAANAENARLKAEIEETKKRAEEERKAAEKDKEQAESERKAAEAVKKQAELEHMAAAEDRKQAAAYRKAAEEAAKQAAADRKAAEEARKKAEAAANQGTELEKGKVYRSGTFQYKVKSVSGRKVSVILCGSDSKKLKGAAVPATVTLKGVTCKVTEIGAKAFKNYKNLTSVTIGANIEKIGAQAFCGDKNMKNIRILSKKLKSVGTKALSGIHSRANIRVPRAKKNEYQDLLKKKGQKKTVKIK